MCDGCFWVAAVDVVHKSQLKARRRIYLIELANISTCILYLRIFLAYLDGAVRRVISARMANNEGRNCLLSRIYITLNWRFGSSLKRNLIFYWRKNLFPSSSNTTSYLTIPSQSRARLLELDVNREEGIVAVDDIVNRHGNFRFARHLFAFFSLQFNIEHFFPLSMMVRRSTLCPQNRGGNFCSFLQKRSICFDWFIIRVATDGE